MKITLIVGACWLVAAWFGALAFGRMIRLRDSIDDLEQLTEQMATIRPRNPNFDWLKEYGPYWEPGSTAFWLEPETPRELANWLVTYRPGKAGIFEANEDVKVEILPIRKPH